eukprot:Blabericola_migrator_1__10572@NODE_5_length_29060_cov_171_088642_g4_i0_p17_GENE_NODE_5_length_29060_cov_171_088642_g4_i0NODE_5_length_29060_cov_171_088642_g4_i0_p17_ORF_typecomplete_len216_score27_92Nas2_N/PF18265_1/8_9e24GRASP55_65/PF04495_14/8_4e07PDZ_6/PF17820_1/0_00013PDZ_2/PF13180_6/0_0015Stk19/PF10494_9/0_21_NODE_5_length_29060_cov_171_088642_g4_i01859219239
MCVTRAYILTLSSNKKVMPDMATNAQMQSLLADRDRMERRAQELTAYLTGPGMPGLKGGLDDAEGYPRADLDIIGIVNARHELACLNTDYNALMKQIESQLHDLHSTSRVHVPRPETPSTLKPFGTVTNVAQNSPGFMAGFENGDLILRFGTLDLNTAPLQTIFEQLPTMVRNKVNKEISLLTRRGDEMPSTRILQPRPWDGPGLLGFRLEPYTE